RCGRRKSRRSAQAARGSAGKRPRNLWPRSRKGGRRRQSRGPGGARKSLPGNGHRFWRWRIYWFSRLPPVFTERLIAMQEAAVNNREPLAAPPKHFARQLLVVLENRVDLLIVEVREERDRLLRAFLLGLGVAVFSFLAGVALTV